MLCLFKLLVSVLPFYLLVVVTISSHESRKPFCSMDELGPMVVCENVTLFNGTPTG